MTHLERWIFGWCKQNKRWLPAGVTLAQCFYWKAGRGRRGVRGVCSFTAEPSCLWCPPPLTSAIQRNMHTKILNLVVMYVWGFFCRMFERAAHVRVQICSGCLCVCVRIWSSFNIQEWRSATKENYLRALCRDRQKTDCNRLEILGKKNTGGGLSSFHSLWLGMRDGGGVFLCFLTKKSRPPSW